MTDTMPKGKITRSFSSGKIAARMGTNHLGFLIKRPFLSKENQTQVKQKLDEKNAKILFQGLSLLRGTALKIAQMLSFEREFFPKSFQRELEKSYHQVAPINRALVRKIIINNFNAPPETMFQSFDTKAFAAASLGQVHRARSRENQSLAVKIQYPDIGRTISNDILLLKTILRPMAEFAIIKTALDEIEQVLLAETDYEKEAQNIEFFSKFLNHPRVRIPTVIKALSTRHVLTMSCMEGMTLNHWLATNPDKESKTQVAQTLNDIFVKGFYELHLIHADPNPGNFLISPDLSVSLLDFGCVRSFEPDFVDLYQALVQQGGNHDKKAYQALLTRMKFITPGLDADISDRMVAVFMEIGDWYSRLFKNAQFDFGANPDFMEKGRQIGMKMNEFRTHINGINPEFIFLDRTRYGLIRLFEKMGVKINIQNQYEYCKGA